MSIITCYTHDQDLPILDCDVQVYENARIRCDIHRRWGKREDSKIIVCLSNCMDFRTKIYLPILKILEEIMNHVPMNTVIYEISLISGSQESIMKGMDIFNDEWEICHQGISIGGKVFNIVDTKLILILN